MRARGRGQCTMCPSQRSTLQPGYCHTAAGQRPVGRQHVLTASANHESISYRTMTSIIIGFQALFYVQIQYNYAPSLITIRNVSVAESELRSGFSIQVKVESNIIILIRNLLEDGIMPRTPRPAPLISAFDI